MSNLVKENGGPLVIGAAVIAIVLGYIELRLPSAVDAEMNSRGLPSTEKITALETADEQNASDIEDVEDDVDDFEDRWNTLVDALAASRPTR